LVREALDHPIGSPRLSELAKGKKNVVVIPSDHTRPVPSKVIMPLMLEEIRKGNPQAHITILSKGTVADTMNEYCQCGCKWVHLEIGAQLPRFERRDTFIALITML